MNLKGKSIKQPIFLCGMMGSGKSTVGMELAKQLNVPFQDLDSLIEEKTGRTITEIFQSDGEESFRKIEMEMLLKVTGKSSGVIALGGGSLQNQHLTDHVKLNGWLIYLQTPVAVLVDRLQGKKGRPMIANDAGKKGDLNKKISSLMKQRIPYYSQAHLTIHRDGLSPQETAADIIDKLAFYEQRHRD